jgi:type II secretory pathway pseudopilin PulG
MKVQALVPGLRQSPPAGSHGAFTLPELLISLTLFTLLMGTIICAHLFGLRMSMFTEAKLNASNSARNALGKMTDEIRNCTIVWVGDVNTNDVPPSFVELLDGVPQAGGALLIQPTTNAANFILYFVNPDDQSFRRTTSAAGTTTTIAQTVTNTSIFTAQDYLGNVLTNNTQNNRVIHLTLEFFQPQPLLPTANYYKLETSVTPRIGD